VDTSSASFNVKGGIGGYSRYGIGSDGKDGKITIQ
jgi:hypothetical protein